MVDADESIGAGTTTRVGLQLASAILFASATVVLAGCSSNTPAARAHPAITIGSNVSRIGSVPIRCVEWHALLYRMVYGAIDGAIDRLIGHQPGECLALVADMDQLPNPATSDQIVMESEQLMTLSDYNCDQYEAQAFRAVANQGYLQSLTSPNSNYFSANRSFDLMSAAISARRKLLRAQISARLCMTQQNSGNRCDIPAVDGYEGYRAQAYLGMLDALLDIMAYDRVCSIEGGLEALSEQVAKSQQRADTAAGLRGITNPSSKSPPPSIR